MSGIHGTSPPTTALGLDVTDEASTAPSISTTSKSPTPAALDILVNWRGRGGHVGTRSFTDRMAPDLDRVYAVNVRGVFTRFQSVRR